MTDEPKKQTRDFLKKALDNLENQEEKVILLDIIEREVGENFNLDMLFAIRKMLDNLIKLTTYEKQLFDRALDGFEKGTKDKDSVSHILDLKNKYFSEEKIDD